MKLRGDQQTQRGLGIFLLFLLLVIVLGFAGWGYYSYRFGLDGLMQTERAQLNASVDDKVRQIIEWHSNILRDLDLIPSVPAVASEIELFLKHPESKELRSRLLVWMTKLQRTHPYERVILIDTKGRIALASCAGTESLKPREHELARHVLVDGIARNTDLHIEDGAPIHMDFLSPVYSPGGEEKVKTPVAVLMVQLNPRHYLYPQLRTLPAGWKTYETLLLRREGDAVLYLSDLRFIKNTALKLSIPLGEQPESLADRAVSGVTGLIQGKDYRNVEVCGVAKPVPGTPWILVTKVDRSEILESFNGQFVMLGVTGAALLVSTIFCLGYVWQRREKHLSKAELQRANKDLAERKKVEESLELQQEFMNTLLENVQSGIVACNARGQLTLFNKVAREWHGLDVMAVQMEEWPKFYNLYAADGVTPLKSGEVPLVRAFNRELIQDCEISISARGKPVRHVLINASPFYDHQMNFLGAVAIMQDVTARGQWEKKIRGLNAELEERVKIRTQQLEDMNKELEAFCYSVSHDLRTPLRAIDGFSEMLVSDYGCKLEEEGVRRLGVISSETRRMGRLIDDLLSFFRIGRQEMQKQEVDMTALARDAYLRLENERTGRTISFKLGVLPPARVDAALIRQLLLNLFDNAIKYTKPVAEAEIVVDGWSEGEENFYRVKDNGVGFDMKYADKLFGVFQRLHSEEQFRGTGVGLALVKRIVARHYGRVWGEGKVNQGAVFTFTLPGRRNDNEQATTGGNMIGGG